MKTYKHKVLFDGNSKLFYIRTREAGYVLRMTSNVILRYIPANIKETPLKTYSGGYGNYNLTNYK